jgi:SAM-dependent methyltransferase
MVLRTRASSRGVNGFLSTERILRELGGKRLDGLGPRRDMVANAIAAPAAGETPASVLRAYLDHFDEVTEARARRMSEMLSSGRSDFALPPSADIEALERRFGGRDAALRRQVMQVDSYFIDAGRFKAPILAHILATVLGERPISLADIGSGPGIVPMELCLDGRLRIDRAVVIDASPSFRATAEAIMRHLDLRGRLECVTATGEEFAFGRRFDAISYISSLLHVRKDRLPATVERAWDALSPGGILVIWENVRSASSVTQSDYMFTATSLDAELGRFGEIRYFSSTAAMEVAPDKVGDQAVFRVVRKPS